MKNFIVCMSIFAAALLLLVWPGQDALADAMRAPIGLVSACRDTSCTVPDGVNAHEEFRGYGLNVQAAVESQSRQGVGMVAVNDADTRSDYEAPVEGP